MGTPTPLDNPTDVLSLTILVEGKELLDTIGVVGVEVVKTINKIPTAQVFIVDGSVSKEDFTVRKI
jgi:hypothetical protein